MRFLSIFTSVEQDTPPSEEEVAEMGKLIEEFSKSGHLLSTEGCLPTALGARVRRTGGEYTVKDGPFTEAKELVAGYWLLQVKSWEEAVEWIKRAPFQEEELEIRQLFELDDFPPGEAIDRFRELDKQIRAQR